MQTKTEKRAEGIAYEQEMLAIVAENMRILRLQRGVTQKDLGDLMGVTQARVSMIERGRRSLGTSSLSRLAVALGTTVDALTTEPAA